MLQYDEQGQGTPVVLIHGFPLCRQMWQPQLKALSGAGFRVICPDLPGFGASPLTEGPISMATYADAVIDLLDGLGVDKAVVGGMSMGGYVLLNLLERYPERLLGAMFIVTRAASDDAVGKEKRTLMAAEVDSGNAQIVPETFAGVLFAGQTSLKRPELIDDVCRWMDATSPAGIVAGLLAMRDRDDFVGKLSGFALQSLVVGAEQDLAVPLEHSRVLAEGLPAATLKIVPGAGHMVNLEQPDRFNAALFEFLARFKA